MLHELFASILILHALLPKGECKFARLFAEQRRTLRMCSKLNHNIFETLRLYTKYPLKVTRHQIVSPSLCSAFSISCNHRTSQSAQTNSQSRLDGNRSIRSSNTTYKNSTVFCRRSSRQR